MRLMGVQLRRGMDKYDSDMIYHPFGRIDGPTSGPLQLRVEIQATLT